MPSRWMHQGLQLVLSAAMIAVSSAVAGWVAMVRPVAEGVATMHAGGEFSGDTDLLYTVEVDSVAGGYGIGEATFRWKTADSAGWEATGVPTSTVAITLNNAVTVQWSAGAGGDQFAAGDQWTFMGKRRYSKARLLDMNPNSNWQATGKDDETITIDLGADQTPTCLWLGDHNCTPGATITLMGNDSDDWGAPAYSQAVDYSAPHCCLFLNETYRYWRVRIQDSGNNANVLVANLFLGTYFQPVDRDYALGWQKTSASPTKRLHVLGPEVITWKLNFVAASPADQAGLKAMWDAVHDWPNRRIRPVVACPNSSDPTETALMLPGNKFSRKQEFGDKFSLQLDLTELPRKQT